MKLYEIFFGKQYLYVYVNKFIFYFFCYLNLSILLNKYYDHLHFNLKASFRTKNHFEMPFFESRTTLTRS